MEEMVTKIGFSITCLSFLCMVCIGTQFLLGVLIGMAITAFGWFFWDD